MMRQMFGLLWLLVCIRCSSLSVTVTDPTINVHTDYEWNLVFNTSLSTSQTITLKFHSLVNLAGATLTDSSGASINFTPSGSNITFAAPSSASSFVFKVSNVLNPPYQTQVIPIAESNSGESLSGDLFTYQMGALKDCSLRFEGKTWDTGSTAQISFTNTNPTGTGSAIFSIDYNSAYTASGKQMASSNVMCSISLNDSAFSSAVSASISTGGFLFTCSFPITLQANSRVVLKLSNIANPATTTGYLQKLVIKTYDANNYYYDTEGSCSMEQVEIASYSTTLVNTSSLIINGKYANPQFQTVSQVSFTFQTNDQIIFEHQNIAFTKLSSFLSFYYPTNAEVSSSFYIINSSASEMYMQANGTFNNQASSNKIRLYLLGFNFTAPSSSTPSEFSFTFLRGGLSFMRIYYAFSATAIVFNDGDGSLSLTETGIGMPSVYNFNLKTSQPLGPNGKILIDLPLEVVLPSSFLVCSSNLAVSSVKCQVEDYNNTVISMQLISNSSIQAQAFQITFSSIENPPNPTITYSFGFTTLYDASDDQSIVQYNTGLFKVSYTKREAEALIMSGSFTVDQSSAALGISYYPGVDIPTGALLKFTFNDSSIKSYSYSYLTIDGTKTTLSPSGTNPISLTLIQALPKSSSVEIYFLIRTPSSTGSFSALTMEVSSASSVVYQYTKEYLILNVDTPAPQVFKISSSSAITGSMANYTVSFYTNIDLGATFILQIQFPSTINISSLDSCVSTSNVCSGLTTESQTVTISMVRAEGSNSYTISLQQIKNPSQIGATDDFTFTTFTKDGNKVLEGLSTLTISKPNSIVAWFEESDFYFKANTNAVTIHLNYTNALSTGDYFKITFSYRTYSLISNTTIKCLECSSCCSVDNDSISTMAVIRVVPTESMLLAGMPIKVTFDGLKSYEYTQNNKSYDIPVQSFSVRDRKMDSGLLTYALSCQSTLAIENRCATCYDNSSCISCYSGYKLYGGKCVSNCGNESSYSYYTTSGDEACVPCNNNSNCSKCIGYNQCLTCISNFYLFEDGSCKSTCPTQNGYYIATVSLIKMCYSCWDSSCLICSNGTSNACTSCRTGYLSEGQCLDDCDNLTSYVTPDGTCKLCNQRCEGCSGSTDMDCTTCAAGYFLDSHRCTDSCEEGEVATDTGCGCDGKCLTCVGTSTNCLSCANASLLLYNFQCLESCPTSSYLALGSCIDCSIGCLNCTSSACTQCLSGYSIYENKCFSQCNNVGPRYSAVNGFCLECPSGCDVCNQTYDCSVCLSGYTLQNSTCVLACSLDNSCEIPSTIPTNVLPLPGLITIFVWTLLIVLLKLFVLKQIYLPYSYMYIGCLVELVLVYSIAIEASSMSSSRRRLEAEGFYSTVVGVLAASLVLNYLFNFAYVGIFCKYLKKYIPDRQIDKVSNYSVLIFGTLTNFRFSLIAFSKMFPKPSICVENASKLTPLHYLCIGTLFTQILPLGAAGILIYNADRLTDLFMLGVDLLVLVLVSLFWTIWMVAVDKPDDYFESQKKFNLEEYYRTEEALNDEKNLKNSMDISKTRLNHLNHSNLEIQDFNDEKEFQAKPESPHRHPETKSDNQNDPLPNIPARPAQANLQALKVQSKNFESSGEGKESGIEMSPREGPATNRDSDINIGQIKIQNRATRRKKEGKKNQGKKSDDEDGIVHRRKEESKNFSKKQSNKQVPLKVIEKESKKDNSISRIDKKSSGMFSEDEPGDNIFDVENGSEPTLKQANSEIIKREKVVQKPQTQRSTVLGRSAAGAKSAMKKKDIFGLFESEQAESVVDQIDLESIIQSKMIDKTKKDGKKTNLDPGPNDQYEEVSPSWFNAQNQRFDIQDESFED